MTSLQVLVGENKGSAQHRSIGVSWRRVAFMSCRKDSGDCSTPLHVLVGENVRERPEPIEVRAPCARHCLSVGPQQASSRCKALLVVRNLCKGGREKWAFWDPPPVQFNNKFARALPGFALQRAFPQVRGGTLGSLNEVLDFDSVVPMLQQTWRLL